MKEQCGLIRSLDWVQETLVMVGDMDTHRDVYTPPPHKHSKIMAVEELSKDTKDSCC